MSYFCQGNEVFLKLQDIDEYHCLTQRAGRISQGIVEWLKGEHSFIMEDDPIQDYRLLKEVTHDSYRKG